MGEQTTHEELMRRVRRGGKPATHICPECKTTYTGPGRCGYYKCSKPERIPLVEAASGDEVHSDAG